MTKKKTSPTIKKETITKIETKANPKIEEEAVAKQTIQSKDQPIQSKNQSGA